MTTLGEVRTPVGDLEKNYNSSARVLLFAYRFPITQSPEMLNSFILVPKLHPL